MRPELKINADLDQKVLLTNSLDNCAKDLRGVAVSCLDTLKLIDESITKVIESIDNTRSDIAIFKNFLENSQEHPNIEYKRLGNELAKRYLEFYTTKVETLQNLLEGFKNTEI